MSAVRLPSFILALLGLVAIAWAASAPSLVHHTTDLTLKQPGSYATGLTTQWLEDASQQLSPEQALASTHWQDSEQENLNFGFSSSAFWLRTTVNNSSEASLWALWIKYSLLDHVELWQCTLPLDDLEDCQQQHAGDQQPFRQERTFDHPNTILPLTLASNTRTLLLVRVQTQGTFQLPILLIEQQQLYQELSQHNVLRGLYYGILLIMGLYNLFIYLPTRSRSYLYYAGFTLSFLLFHMVYEGSAFQYFWPNHPQLNNYALPFFYALNMLWLTFFVPSFLNLREQNSNVFRMFRGYSALIVVSLLTLPLLQYHWVVPFYSGLNILLTFSALFVSLYFWAKGNRSARLFAIAWLAFILGLFLANARSLGLLPTNTVTLFAYQIGSFIEIVLLSFALAERIVLLQQEKEQANQATLAAKEQSIGYLRDYEDLYQNSLVGKFELDKDGYFIKSNAAWREIVGYYDEQHFLDENPAFDSLFSNNKQRRRFWRTLKENGQVQSYLLDFVQPTSGERIVVSLTVRKGADMRYAWFGSGQNVTENFLKEQALIQLQKEKAQSLRQLVQGVSAEMQAPIEKFRHAENYLRLDEQLHPLDDETQQQLTQGLTLVRQGNERLHELNALMQGSIINSDDYPLEAIRIRDWLDAWQLQQMANHAQLHIHISVHSYLVEWPTYPKALTWVLDQLLDNSCNHNEALYDAGELKINLEIREHGEFLELHYQDNGVGIEASQRETIFMPFYSTKSDSSNKGLGLYQAYNLISELMQGVIEWPEDSEGFHLIIRFAMPLPGDFAGAE